MNRKYTWSKDSNVIQAFSLILPKTLVEFTCMLTYRFPGPTSTFPRTHNVRFFAGKKGQAERYCVEAQDCSICHATRSRHVENRGGRYAVMWQPKIIFISPNKPIFLSHETFEAGRCWCWTTAMWFWGLWWIWEETDSGSYSPMTFLQHCLTM